MNVPAFFQALSERLESSANVRNVYGEPIAAAGKTIIPVARIAYGFGGGTGKKGTEQEQGQEGGGGGGGMKAHPVGVVEVTPEGTRFVAFADKRKLAGAAALGFALGALVARRR